MPRNSGGQTKGKPVPIIEPTVSLDSIVHVEALDSDWNPIPFAAGDYLTIEDAKAYIDRELAVLQKVKGLFLPGTFIPPVFTIDGDQYPASPVPCDGCGAEGVVVVHLSLYDADDAWVSCPVCDGRGEVTA